MYRPPTFRRMLCVISAVIAVCLLAAQPASTSTLWREIVPGLNTITPSNRTLCPETPQNRPINRVNTTARLLALRSEMLKAGADAYLVFMTDEHGSSGGPYDARVEHISGFSGSSGWVAVTKTQAAMWTDGRYFLQADDQMDCNWILMKSGFTGYPTAQEWLKQVLQPFDKVGAFPNYVGTSTWLSYESTLAQANISLVSVNKDLIDIIWTTGRPAKPNIKLMVHSLTFAGKTWEVKLADVRTEQKENVLVVSVLEQVAWLFNLRSDELSNPVFYAYAILEKTKSTLYLRNHTVLIGDVAIRDHLRINASGYCTEPTQITCIMVRDYDQVYNNIEALSTSNAIWIDPTANYAIYNSSGDRRTVSTSPIELMKSTKNPVEREQFTKCIMRDSAAVVEFIAELEQEIKAGKNWTEISAENRLFQIRRQYENNRGVSFDTISGFGPNGAIIHYRATPDTDRRIDNSSTYLLDSGGQYLDGTTDITRTFHFGTPTDQIKEAYTRVLMGQIDLAQTVWPAGLYGSDIEARARVALWQNGLDYNHGTGHGIGYFLSVHEGPASISLGYRAGVAALYEGMVFSDEPGYYEDGQFGIRLEMLVMIVKATTEYQFNGKTYLAFKPLTLVPYETHLINYTMMSNTQIQWLNAYNKRCLDEVGAYLKDVRNDTRGYDWIVARTQVIGAASDGSTSGALDLRPTGLGYAVVAGLFIARVMYLTSCS